MAIWQSAKPQKKVPGRTQQCIHTRPEPRVLNPATPSPLPLPTTKLLGSPPDPLLAPKPGHRTRFHQKYAPPSAIERARHAPRHLLLEGGEVVAKLLRGVEVGGGLVGGVGEHGDDADDNGLDRVDGVPAHGRALLGVCRVLARLMQDRDAHVAVGVHVGVPDRGDKLHLGRPVRVSLGEYQLAVEDAALVQGLRWAGQAHIPLVEVRLIRKPRREELGGALAQLFELLLKHQRAAGSHSCQVRGAGAAELAVDVLLRPESLGCGRCGSASHPCP
mmetsp:Transcript_31325/g.78807  ORF Transcript_31325/g.78807 Transcript_31325/m.78807 type:complete len:275 (-) Transcript_31325:172-996(-)